jgi:Dyp-type peroxidase family
MVAADRIADAEHGVQFAKKTLKGFVLVGEPIVGTNLPGDQHGHEHFGFLDGVSQPGIRGRISNNKHDVLTVRQNPNNRQQGKPGQELIWPGEFIFGYPGQEGNPDADPEKPFRLPGPVSGGVPDWACDGSYLVFRKLKQDVAKFHKFLNDEATGRKLPSAEFLGSKLVGRWPSGSPAMRTPTTDIPQLGDDDCGNNNFEFQETTDKLPLSSTDRFDCTDQPGYPNATQDRKGLKCPFTAHIRKAYPRDDVTLDQTHPTTKLRGGDFVRTTEKDPEDFSDDPQGTPIKLQEDDTQSHRILRRGIPFGKDILRHDPETPSTPSNPASDDGEDRGLLFFCYQTSIEDQFEFIIRNWVNNRDFKEPFDDAGLPQPRKPNELGGDDPIIGQNNIDDNRERTFTFTIGEGKDATAGQITTQEEWVLPTAGGYFFTPSIHGLHVLAGVAQP